MKRTTNAVKASAEIAAMNELARRIWDGQSPDLSYEERMTRILKALRDRGFSNLTEHLQLPNEETNAPPGHGPLATAPAENDPQLPPNERRKTLANDPDDAIVAEILYNGEPINWTYWASRQKSPRDKPQFSPMESTRYDGRTVHFAAVSGPRH